VCFIFNRQVNVQMKTLISLGSIVVGSIALNLIPVQQAQAVSLLNGNFTPATGFTGIVHFGDSSATDSTTVTNWVSEGYNFLVSSGTGLATANNLDGNDPVTGLPRSVNFYGTSLTAPNGAGYYVASDGAYDAGRISQDITGLTIGQIYKVNFYQAAAQQVNYSTATTDYWQANVGGTYVRPTYGGVATNTNGETNGTGGFTGGTTYNSQTMSLASKGTAGSQTTTTGNAKVNGWQQDSFAFTASATTQKLSFFAKGSPSGKPPFALLSGVSVQQIPEPDTYVGTLLGLGCLGLVIKSRLAKKKSDE
jgi:hypothetical protein